MPIFIAQTARQKQREKVTAVRERWGRDGEREGERE